MTAKNSWEILPTGSKIYRYGITFRSGVINEHKLIYFNDQHYLHRLVKCSRWAELTETLKFHVNTAHIAGGPTEFRMLNGKLLYFILPKRNEAKSGNLMLLI